MDFSVNGTPRLASTARPASHGPQLLVVYSVTGYLAVTCFSSYGSVGLAEPELAASDDPVPPALGLPTTAAGTSWGGLSENVTFPSGPTDL